MLWEMPFEKVVQSLDYLLSLVGFIKIKLRLDYATTLSRQASDASVPSEDEEEKAEAETQQVERI